MAAVVATLVLAAMTPLCRAADLTTASTFLAHLYAHYPLPHDNSAFDPTGRDAKAVFDPAMVALLRENDRLTPRGDVGAIDWDPLCDCQDDSGMVASVGEIHPSGPGAAIAKVRLRFTQAKPVEESLLTFQLVAVQGQWRIRDVKEKATPSLRALLARANRAARRRR